MGKKKKFTKIATFLEFLLVFPSGRIYVKRFYYNFVAIMTFGEMSLFPQQPYAKYIIVLANIINRV